MPGATIGMNQPAEQAAVKVFSEALGIRLSNSDLNSGGLFRAISRLCGNIWHRLFYVAFSSVTAVCSLSGLRSITAVNAVVASVFLGPERALKLVGASVAVVAVVGCARACATAPSGGVFSEEFVKKLSKEDQATWGTLLQLTDTLEKVTENMPVLNVPKLVHKREENPSEVLLRILAVVYQHQAPLHHTPHPNDQYASTEPKSAVAVARGDQYIVASLRAMADGYKGDKAAEKAESICSSSYDTVPRVAGSAHQRQGTPAPTLLINELREWMEYAEATYYHMKSEEQIEEWLSDRGWNLLHASFENRPHMPVHFIAANSENKKLLVSVRGTESMSDAVTDMIVTPLQWGDRDERVHSGIGASAEALFHRLRHIAEPFAATGYSVVLVGHSLGAGVAALLAWLLRERCGISQLRAIAYATPACASRSIGEASKDYVVSCVMRDDAVPRMSPRALVALQQEALAMTWKELEQCAHAWGAVGRSLYRNARGVCEKSRAPVESHAVSEDGDAVDTPLLPPMPPMPTSHSSTAPAKSHPITCGTESQDPPSPQQSNPNPPKEGASTSTGSQGPAGGDKAIPKGDNVQVMSQTLADVNAASALVSNDVDCIDSLDDKLMVPFVPGTVVFLHPMQSLGVKRDKDGKNIDTGGSSEGDTVPENPENAAPELLHVDILPTEAADPSTDATATNELSAVKVEFQETGEAEVVRAEVDGGPQEYNRFVIERDALTLGTIRLHPQGLNDHFLDQYRTGLGMRPVPDAC